MNNKREEVESLIDKAATASKSEDALRLALIDKANPLCGRLNRGGL